MDEGNSSKSEFLSDLLQDRMVSCAQGWGELRLDAAAGATGQASPKIRIKDKEYARGIGCHANSEIVVDLGGQFKTFEADVGLQWSDGKSAGSVVFQIFVDGKKVFDSGVVRENDPPRAVAISVEGAEELRLVATDAGDGITADVANWADARLLRDPATKPTNAEASVDVAKFAQVLSWNPKIMEGTKASRSEEFPAEDIAPYKEILPSTDKTYAVPSASDKGCIGLQWDENRLLRRVAIEFPSADAILPAESVQLQYWTGESEWQGKWQPVAVTPEKQGNRLVWRFGYLELPQGTQKVRWVFSDVKQPIVLKGISAFTRSRWKTVDVRLEAARPGVAKQAKIEIYNGEFLNASEIASTYCTWDSSKPLLLKVRASAQRPYKADRTVLRIRTPDAAFGIAVEDLLTHDCVHVPHANVFATREPSPITAEAYLKKIAGQQSTLEEVRQKPDQDFRHACAAIHNPIQDMHGWVPMLISLACDNRKFLVYRDGSIVFNEYNQADDYPGESDGVHTIAANIGQWRFAPSFGVGQPMTLTRHLNGGWLPMPVTTVTDKNVTYQQTTFIAPEGDTSENKPLWLRERALAVAEYSVKNTGTEPSEARLLLNFTSQQDPKKTVELREVNEGVMVVSGDRVLAFLDKRKATGMSLKLESMGVVLSGMIPVGGECSCSVILPAWKVSPNDYSSLLKENALALRCEQYWKKLLESAMQIEIPDEFLSNLFRASQVNCMLAARNQEQMKFVVPWISSIHFAYPESEANSIIRGMDMTGHPEFARRGLDFYLKECNEAGFITILVHNKVAGISCGYTIVGTGEVLWTLGEHYQHARDRDWMKTVAPDVVRICKWIIKQREKTKRLDALGEKVPEYGLMPPGVSADWNRFAYRFFNEAQYCRGLEYAGKALLDIGDPAAQAILDDAKAYREDIARAYHAMQAKMPVVPLKNGTWTPADPSLLGCYGNVENFLPGEDANRSDVYSVELGAHHLVANELLDPNSQDADWMIDYLEDVQFLRSNWIKDKNNFSVFDWGGFAKMQPYYCRIAEIYAKRDDVKPFIRSYFNMIPAQVNFEELTFWEDMGVGGYASGAMNKTHETGWFLGQTKTMFVRETDDALWLAPCVTSQWLKDGRKVAARNVPTRFGKVSYVITSKVGQGEIEAVVQLPEGCTAKQVILRLRHPEGKPMQSVTVQGKPHADFDREKETVTLGSSEQTITVKAKY
jgi:hypothetical protein